MFTPKIVTNDFSFNPIIFKNNMITPTDIKVKGILNRYLTKEVLCQSQGEQFKILLFTKKLHSKQTPIKTPIGIRRYLRAVKCL